MDPQPTRDASQALATTGGASALTASFVREALHRAIHGLGPLPAAARAAEHRLRRQDGDTARAVRELIHDHVRYAGAQGFLTSLGGLVTAPVTIPANVTGLALVETRMIAGIAHLRGYDLADPRVRNAVLACVIEEKRVDELVREQRLPAPPMALATAPVHDPDLDALVTSEVTADLLARITGRRMAVSVTRKVPVFGGLVGLGVDGYATWRAGKYAEREFLPRRAPSSD